MVDLQVHAAGLAWIGTTDGESRGVDLDCRRPIGPWWCSRLDEPLTPYQARSRGGPPLVAVALGADDPFPVGVLVDRLVLGVVNVEHPDAGELFVRLPAEHTAKALDPLPDRSARRRDDADISRGDIEPLDERFRAHDHPRRAIAKSLDAFGAEAAGKLAVLEDGR